jgi:hypothetical protein
MIFKIVSDDQIAISFDSRDIAKLRTIERNGAEADWLPECTYRRSTGTWSITQNAPGGNKTPAFELMRRFCREFIDRGVYDDTARGLSTMVLSLDRLIDLMVISRRMTETETEAVFGGQDLIEKAPVKSHPVNPYSKRPD